MLLAQGKEVLQLPKNVGLTKPFGAIAQTVEQILYDVFISGTEPRVSEHRDRDGTFYYRVYDPVYDETYKFASVDEVCTWIEQLYYRH